ncbi:14374_t:CDS:2 [Gigaspora margarita]|uniref:14374_t:CDS:1 n=1 Tax=Gigaspora margarita TaxID=4874 RepID=A0ABN7V4V1_GIGMA|nr:14374_t:CDS:2 [Gigaspora margarita]
MNPFKNSISLWLIIILVWTAAGANGFTPPGRFRQSNVLVGNRLYFFGSQNTAQERDNIYLDVTLSTLNTTNPSWFMPNSIPAGFQFASACVGGPNKNTIYLLNHLNTSDGDTAIWSTPNISGQIPLSRQQFQAVNDTNGVKYPNPSIDVILNDIYILDTSILAWVQGSNVNAPTPRGIGVGTIYMSEIPTYNTNNNSWNTMFATGDTLNSRSCHTAALSPDGHVIIYGGDINGSTDQSQVLAPLDTIVNPYKWSIKPIIGVIMANNSFDNVNNVNLKIYLLDTRNYTWVTLTSISPNSSHPQDPTVTQFQTVIVSDSNSLSTGAIVTIPLVLIAVLAIAGFIGFWFYKNKN